MQITTLWEYLRLEFLGMERVEDGAVLVFCRNEGQEDYAQTELLFSKEETVFLERVEHIKKEEDLFQFFHDTFPVCFDPAQEGGNLRLNSWTNLFSNEKVAALSLQLTWFCGEMENEEQIAPWKKAEIYTVYLWQEIQPHLFSHVVVRARSRKDACCLAVLHLFLQENLKYYNLYIIISCLKNMREFTDRPGLFTGRDGKQESNRYNKFFFEPILEGQEKDVACWKG